MKKLDFHVHICCPGVPAAEMEENFRDMIKRHDLCGVGIMALHHVDEDFFDDCNDIALRLRERLPGSYAFAAVRRDRDLVEQAKEIQALGFDGIKLLDGKPSEYRFFGSGYETPEYDRFFAYCEAEQIPLMIHNNDPRANWMETPKTPKLREKGWFYGDGDVPSQEEFFRMLEGVLRRHPNLRAAIAHLGFYYDDLPRAAGLLEACPNLFFDMTPAVPVFVELSARRDEAEAFIRKYHDRLIYGTDASADMRDGNSPYRFNNTKHEIMDVFYEGDAPREVGKAGYHIEPVRLEPYMLENIYYNNALRFMNK